VSLLILLVAPIFLSAQSSERHNIITLNNQNRVQIISDSLIMTYKKGNPLRKDFTKPVGKVSNVNLIQTVKSLNKINAFYNFDLDNKKHIGITELKPNSDNEWQVVWDSHTLEVPDTPVQIVMNHVSISTELVESWPIVGKILKTVFMNLLM
jgi:hypothetical protein